MVLALWEKGVFNGIENYLADYSIYIIGYKYHIFR